MVDEDFVAQAGAVNVDVDFGGSDALVAQHLLDGTQIGTTFKQMGCKTVAQRVGTDDLAHSGKLTQLFDNVENHLTREHRATTVGEQDVLAAALSDLMGTRLLKIEVYLLDGNGRNGHEALLVALALDDDIMLVHEELREFEGHKLAHAQSATVERLDDGTVALPLGLGHVDRSNHTVDFIDCKHLWQVPADFGREQQLRRVCIHVALQPQELVKALHTADDARLGPRLDAHILQGADKALQVIGCGSFNRDTDIGEVTSEFIHIVTIGLGRVGTHSLFQGEIPQKTPLHTCYVSNITQEGF